MKQGARVSTIVSAICKVICCGGRSGGRTSWPPLVLHSHYKPTNEGHVAPKHWATCPHTIHCQRDTCQHPIGQPPTNKNAPCLPPAMSSWWYGPTTCPYGLYGQVQSASQIFACLAWRTDRDISSIRTLFAKVNIPPESRRRDGRNGTFSSQSEYFENWAKFDPLITTTPGT